MKDIGSIMFVGESPFGFIVLKEIKGVSVYYWTDNVDIAIAQINSAAKYRVVICSVPEGEGSLDFIKEASLKSCVIAIDNSLSFSSRYLEAGAKTYLCRPISLRGIQQALDNLPEE